ncbi:MAG: ABC transporter permease [Pseudomonadota bacterium]
MRIFRSTFEQSIALLLALVIGSLIIVGIGENPIVAYATLLDGAFGSPQRIAGTLLQSTPIMIAGMAACVAFRSGLFNIGVEGQLYMGGFAAALIGFSLPLPWFLHLPLAMIVAVIAGAAWIAVPAFFRARYNANEVVSTILLNYVAVLLTSYFTIFLFKRPGGWSETPPILESSMLPTLFEFSRLNYGLFIGLALAVGLHFYFLRTVSGFESGTMGSNQRYAEYGGVNIRAKIFRMMLVSGAIGGLAGGVETLGVHHRFMEGFAPGFGFDGVIAALLANANPLLTVITALFFGILRSGSLLLEVDTTMSREIITVLQALIILCVSAQVRIGRRGDATAGERRWKY